MPHALHEPVDFVIFVPLEEERDAVLSKLPGHRKLDSDGTDVHVYFEAEIATRRQDKAVYRVIVVSPSGMGPIHAAVTASALATRWRPEHVIVVGIAGGLKDEIALGDVMVARSVADYTVGKVQEDGSREERWESYPADAALLNAANAFGHGWHDLVTTARPEGTDVAVRHAGVIASGGDVIASKDLIAAYRKDMPKLIGVEMEGGGVATALHSAKLRPRFLMIRGTSDLADGDGNATMKKKWRAYARDVAAAYAVGLLRDGPVPAVPRSASPNPR
jgi:nucleoside phosphorylase